MAHESNGRAFDPGARAILAELRDLRVELRAERRQDRAEWRQDREARQRAEEERLRADAARQQRSDDRFERLMRELHADSARREAGLQKSIKELRVEMRTIGLSIVRALIRQGRDLKYHTRLLERIDRKLGVRGNGRSGPEDGRRA